MKQPGLDEIKNIFLEDMEINKASQYTLRNYRANLKFFSEWLKQKEITRLADITEQVVAEFRTYLQYFRMRNGSRFENETLGHYVSSIKRFFRFCIKKGYILYDPADEIKRPTFKKKMPRVILTQKEVEKIMSIPDTNTVMGYRNRCIFETLYATGIRNSELRNLTLEDIDIKKGTVRVLNGKGGVDRIVPLNRTAGIIIDEYINKVRPILKRHADELTEKGETTAAGKNKEYLFVSRRGAKMSAFALRKMIMTHIRKSGFPKRVSAHTFRHSAATHLLENGMNVRYIQEFLGHKSLETTQIYTRVTISDLKRVYSKYNPRKK